MIEVKSITSGYVENVEALALGTVSMKLGGGRQKITDPIDYSAGLILNKKVGDYVHQGETLVFVHTNRGLDEELKMDLLNAYHFTDEYVEKPVLIEEIL